MNQVLCKWVSEDMKTRNDTFWEEGVPNELPERNNLKLCNEGLFHYYKHPLIAVFFQYSYACADYSRLYEVLPEGKIVEDWSKCGSTKLTLVKELEIPKVSVIQTLAFTILCALAVCEDPIFVGWANNWLSGKDRSKESTEATYDIMISIDHSHSENGMWAACGACNAACAISYAVDLVFYIVDAISAMPEEERNKIDLVSLAHKAMEIQ